VLQNFKYDTVNYWGNSDLLKGYPTVKPVMKDRSLHRFIGGTNKLVAGVLIQQQRAPMVACAGDAFGKLFFAGNWRNKKLGNLCRSESEVSTDAYGVDPVFLSASSMYSYNVFRYRNEYYNYSDTSQVSTAAVPYGFHHRNFASAEMDGFFIFIDNNFEQTRASHYLNMITEGFYIDALTTQIVVRFLFYNGYFGHFTACTVSFDFAPGGTITMTEVVKNFNGSPYQTGQDFIRFLLEVLLLGLVFGQFVFECLDCYAESLDPDEGTFSSDGLYKYICDPYQILDWLSIFLFAGVFGLWFGVYVPAITNFQPSKRYNVYSDYNAPANFMNSIAIDSYTEMVQMYHDADHLVQLMGTYMQLNGFCLLLVLFKVMKLLDFQPRLGIITKTITAAATDLVHFFIVLFLILGIYTVMSYYLFGSAIDAFSDIVGAWNANYYLLLGSTDYNAAIMKEYPVMGFIFFYSFNLIVFFILLNVLLAIIVEAYLKVAEECVGAESLSYELYTLGKGTYRSLEWGRETMNQDEPGHWQGEHYLSSEEILEHLPESPEDNLITNRSVIKVPVSDGLWLDAGLPAIRKALSIHPHTKHLDGEVMNKIACTMIYRFGKLEGESVEESVSSLFSAKELVALASEISEGLAKRRQGGSSSLSKEESNDVDALSKSMVYTPRMVESDDEAAGENIPDNAPCVEVEVKEGAVGSSAWFW